MEDENLRNIFRAAVLALVVAQLVGFIVAFDLRPLIFVAAMVLLVSGLPYMNGSFRNATTIFLGLGALLLMASRQPLSSWIAAASSLSNIVSIVAVMQLFSLPIRLGGYDHSIRSWVEGRFSSRSALFIFTTLVVHLLTSFLNLGSIPLSVSLFGEPLRKKLPNYERFMAAAATRGYVLSALWSPGAVNLYLVVQATGLPWSRVFLPGLILALIGMALSVLIELPGAGLLGRRGGGQDLRSTEARPGAFASGATTEGVLPAWHVLVVVILFVVATFLLDAFSIGAPGSRIVATGILISSLWSLLFIRKKGFRSEVGGLWSEGLFKVADIGPFFVAMGLFSGSLESSGTLASIAPLLEGVSKALGGASVVIAGFLIVAGSLVGLHPFITIVLFGKMLSQAGLPLPTLTLALGLAAGGVAAYMVSPFAGVIMTLARLLGAKASDVALRWNWRFTAVFFAVGMIFAFIWGRACG